MNNKLYVIYGRAIFWAGFLTLVLVTEILKTLKL